MCDVEDDHVKWKFRKKMADLEYLAIEAKEKKKISAKN